MSMVESNYFIFIFMSKETQYLVNIMLSSLTSSKSLLKEAKKYEKEVAEHFAEIKSSQAAE